MRVGLSKLGKQRESSFSAIQKLLATARWKALALFICVLDLRGNLPI